tara:strand:+ start:347 stop:703 length:357 start_codon:yes stop_codon:yes gene_type:complete
MKKVKKMADGGISGLGSLLPVMETAKPLGGGFKGPIGAILPGFGGGDGGGGGGSAMDGLGTVNQGASAIGSALGRASAAIGGGGGGGVKPSYEYKKGGQVTTTRRISTAERSKKCGDW